MPTKRKYRFNLRREDAKIRQKTLFFSLDRFSHIWEYGGYYENSAQRF